MGASKRLCEMIIQTYVKISKTSFVAVRFGNVLGSNGSVIPKFKKQIAQGGPVTVTHPDIIRYFMTIPEAVQLVLKAGSMAAGGEIFVLDMGEPVSIDKLARDLISLSGFEPGVDIDIVYTGLRPGEKLYEELLMAEEGITATSHNKIHVAKPIGITMQELEDKLSLLREALNNEDINIIEVLEKVVPTYKRNIE
jgi:FlaA1/EpsC-like NDP-sugar epimerase